MALALAGVGISGVIASAVELRRTELASRIALGSSVSDAAEVQGRSWRRRPRRCKLPLCDAGPRSARAHERLCYRRRRYGGGNDYSSRAREPPRSGSSTTLRLRQNQLGNNSAPSPGNKREVGQPERKTSQQHRQPGPACKTPIPDSHPGGASNSNFLSSQRFRRSPGLGGSANLGTFGNNSRSTASIAWKCDASTTCV